MGAKFSPEILDLYLYFITVQKGDSLSQVVPTTLKSIPVVVCNEVSLKPKTTADAASWRHFKRSAPTGGGARVQGSGSLGTRAHHPRGHILAAFCPVMGQPQGVNNLSPPFPSLHASRRQDRAWHTAGAPYMFE